MTNHRLALALLALAALLYLGVAYPRGKAALRATDEYARLRRNRLQTRAKIAALEKRVARLADGSRLPSNTAAVDRPLTHVRRIILSALENAPISDVRLQIRADSRGGRAQAHLSAQGRFVDLGRLAGRVTRPETKLVLERVMLAPAEKGAVLELNVVWIGGGS